MSDQSAPGARHRGRVKWYRKDKGYGFVIHKDGGKDTDLFFHISEFKPDVMPQPDQTIEYKVIDTKKGLKAVDCVILSTDA